MIKVVPLTGNPSLAGWFKSSFSATNSHCVEANFDRDGIVLIRDSKDHGDGPSITMTADRWMAFLDELTNPALADPNGAVSIETTTTGTILLRSTHSHTTLRFTKNEWDMFLAGVHAHEFDHPDLAARAS